MTFRHSSIASTSSNPTNSFTSSSVLQPSSLNSSVSSSSSSLIDYCYTRCEGLDLLVKAVIHVGGSFFLSVPFIQRRVIRRRKRALWFRNSFITHQLLKKEDEKESEESSKKEESIEMISNKPKKRKRVMSLPSKYQDSVLQPWKRRIRRGSRSIDVD